MSSLGLIAGNGRLPFLVADAARDQGHRVIAIGHRGETDASLATHADIFRWVRIGQVNRIAKLLRDEGATQAVMAGGFARMKAFAQARPDFGALSIVRRLRSFRDDALLREIAAFFERKGLRIVSATQLLPKLTAPEGLLAGPPLTQAQRRDVSLGIEVCRALGVADVGQSVVVQGGHVLALEAVEGTDATIERGAALARQRGGVVVKLAKPQQDTRFDLPAVGPATIQLMQELELSVLAVEAGKALLIDAADLLRLADRAGISVVGVTAPPR